MTESADSRNPLIERIEGVARRAGEKATLVDGERRLTYAAVRDLSARLSGRLLAPDPSLSVDTACPYC
jgi:hypothetical protein